MQLFNHQVKVLEATKHRNRVAYYLDMGLGKTFIGSEKATQLNKNILLICQKSKISDWLEHFKTYYEWSVYNLTNKKEYSNFFYQANNSIGIINYELAWRREELLKLKGFTLMLDESSLIQNSKAKQTKFILKLKSENVVLLSGTPCSGKYENLWTQAKLLGWSLKESVYNTEFVNYEYLTDWRGRKKMSPTGIPIRIVTGYKNEERLKRKLREHGATFMKTDEVFDLPNQNFISVNVPVIKAYKDFMKNSIVKIDDIELIGNTTLTKILNARMLCGHFNKEKIKAIEDLMASTNDRLIIFYNFNAELDELIKACKKHEKPISQVNGAIKDLKAYEAEENSVTLCQYQAASKGLNLQKANKIIYFTPTQSIEDWMQSQKRIHRIGQGKPCFYYKLTCENSIEEKIYQALERGVNYTNELFKEDCK